MLMQSQGKVYGTQAPQPGPYSSQENPNQPVASPYGVGAKNAGVGATQVNQMWQSLPGAGNGAQFSHERMANAADILARSQTDNEAGGYEIRQQLRDQLGQAANNFAPAGMSARDQMFADNERSLSRNLSQARASMGGRGIGGLQQGRNLGSMLGEAQRANTAGAQQFDMNRGQQLKQLSDASGGLLQQELQQRGYGLNQAKTLSDLLQKQAFAEQEAMNGSKGAEGGPSGLETGIGYAMQAGMIAAMAFSDERLKEEIRPGGDDIEAFLESVEPYSYKYKDPEHGAGAYVSVMAQDLEKTELGRDLVIETPQGKLVDYGKAFGLMLAANVHLYKEIKELREKLK